jgi:hypothetical protein
MRVLLNSAVPAAFSGGNILFYVYIHFLVNFRTINTESQGENLLKYLLNPSENKENNF